jgi:hypothetical protein
LLRLPAGAWVVATSLVGELLSAVRPLKLSWSFLLHLAFVGLTPSAFPALASHGVVEVKG